jgi:hypothetical protein
MTACRLRVWGSAYAGATVILLLQQPLDKPGPRSNDIQHQLRKEPDNPAWFVHGTYGGGFGYDFTIYFSNEDSMNSFFSNEEYLKIKARHFEKSVTDTTIIATYGR